MSVDQHEPLYVIVITKVPAATIFNNEFQVGELIGNCASCLPGNWAGCMDESNLLHMLEAASCTKLAVYNHADTEPFVPPVLLAISALMGDAD